MAAPWRRGVVAMGTACGRARGRRGKMAAPVSVCHVACCANRAGGGAVSWGRRGLLAFGSCRDVVLYQPAVSGRGRGEAVCGRAGGNNNTDNDTGAMAS